MKRKRKARKVLKKINKYGRATGRGVRKVGKVARRGARAVGREWRDEIKPTFKVVGRDLGTFKGVPRKTRGARKAVRLKKKIRRKLKRADSYFDFEPRINW